MNSPIRGRRELLIGGLAVALAATLEACGSSSKTAATTPATSGTTGANSTTGASSTTAAAATTVAPATTAPAVASGPTIAELAATNPEFALFDAALQVAAKTGHDVLPGSGPVTVFVPVNDAVIGGIDQLNSMGLLPMKTERAIAIGNYHIIDGMKSAADLATMNGQDVATHHGGTVKIVAAGGAVTVNGAKVVTADIAFSDGLIHFIDTFLIPADVTGATAPAAPTGSSLADLIATNPDLSLFAAAVKVGGFAEFLSTGSNFTVFAPSNDAFITTLERLDLTDEVPAGGEWINYMTYHFVPSLATAADLAKMGGGELPTLAGPSLTVTASGADIMINDSKVTTADVTATNGVLHIIDTFLVPPVA